MADVNTTTGAVSITAGPGTRFDRLRNLAQLAANMVDYIDSDDISTVFQWNTSAATDVVYGVEKPRLVINEAYGEVANDPMDAKDGTGTKPAGPAHVRFWVELLNPTQPLKTPGASVNPIGDGGVPLNYAAQGFSPYRLEIGRAGSAGTASLIDPANVEGKFGGNPDILFQFDAMLEQDRGPSGTAPRFL